MPRVQINFPREPSAGEPILNVNWRNSPDGAGHVQVSMEVSRAYLEMALTNMNGNRPDTSLLWSDALGRGECNTLIKAIRTGRDGAYGRDE